MATPAGVSSRVILPEVSRQSLRHTVLHRIRHAIITGELRGGQQLNETDLASQLGVSRGLIREVIRELETSGIVVSIPFRGTFVKDWTATGISEVFTLRCRLEQYALELALPRITDADIRAAEAILQSIRQAAAAGDTMQLVDLDMQLHHQLCAASGHTLLLRTLESLGGQTCMIIMATQAYNHISTAPFEEDQVRSHQVLVDAVRSRDIARVRDVLEAHICGVGNRLCEQLKEQKGRTK
jgi:DNA-binding GntR family transcriptional regulator